MFRNARQQAVILSMSVTFAATVVWWLLSPDVPVVKLIAGFVISSVIGFAILHYALGKLFARRLKDLQEAVGNGAIDVGDSLDAMAGAVEQILAQKQLEIDRLKKLEALRKDFIADVSHELKTPIFAAQGFVHTLLDGAVKEKRVRKKFLKKAAKSLDGLDMLVQDLLTLSQIETGQIKMKFGMFDLYALTQEVFEQFKAKVDKKDITLRIEGIVRKVMAYGDSQRIGQVMTNLISNAIKHSPEGSEVIVSFSVRKKSVVTSVRDYGEGIPAEHLHRVFERFYRVDKSRSREKGGTGLGLAIVKHILDGHHTKAEVESEPGKGSKFSFRLPREQMYGTGAHEAQTE